MMMRNKPVLTVVGPVFNEQDCIEEFYSEIGKIFSVLPYEYELIFVDDGSKDRSPEILREIAKRDSRVKIIYFTRNFGHQIAIKAGIDHAMGEAVIIIDTDLQDPPSAIRQLIEKWEEGFDVVYAVREQRKGETFFKKITSFLYYRLIRKLARVDIPLDAGDFRIISKTVANELKKIGEQRPYLRGLISWLGFKQIGVGIIREARFAGKTKYSLQKMLHLAWSGITHFSFLPLQFATYIGIVTAIICVLVFIWTLYTALVLKITVQGWASLMVAILFVGSVQLVTLGILGSYLAKNYDETRARPLYLIQRKEGF